MEGIRYSVSTGGTYCLVRGRKREMDSGIGRHVDLLVEN